MKSGLTSPAILVRISLSFILAAVAIGMFIMTHKSSPPSPDQETEPVEDLGKIAAMAVDVDRQVDTVLSHLGIENGWIKKRQLALPNTTLQRTERRIAIPRDIVPVLVNQALNKMAKTFQGRAVASENTKENTVTIHIEIRGVIIQTIILKPEPGLEHSFRRIPPSRV